MGRSLTLALAASVLAASATLAQEPAKAAVNDSLFALAAADSGMAEVSLSQLCLAKATNAELKQFSQKMIEEHTRLNQELVSLAGQKRIALPRAVDARAQFCAESLAGLSGEHFDRCYAKAQLVAHMEAMAAFEAEAERGQDPQMKALAAKALTHIKEHLATIKPIAAKLEDRGSSVSER